MESGDAAGGTASAGARGRVGEGAGGWEGADMEASPSLRLVKLPEACAVPPRIL